MAEESKFFEIGVEHMCAGKIYTFLTDDSSLNPGDHVVIEEEEGLTALAKVVTKPLPAKTTEGRKKIVRKATEADILKEEELSDKAVEYMRFCKDRVRERELPMKIVGARFYDSAKKLVFFFVSDGRVDFRLLVKELAQTLKLRIELRQIGARDGSKICGCVGPCGRMTCCSSYLRHFQSISVGMAKNQALSPNPTKLTGMCNKLKCCLAYEDKLYAELRRDLPYVGDKVKTPAGDGWIIELRVPTKLVFVDLPDEQKKWFKVEEIEVIERGRRECERRGGCREEKEKKEEKKEEKKLEAQADEKEK